MILNSACALAGDSQASSVAGSVRIRSNVVTEKNRVDLVPGDLIHLMPAMREETRLQHDEHMYYVPCSLCRRTIAEILLTGCDRCPFAPSPGSVLASREEYRRRVDRARELEVEENAALPIIR